MEAFVTILTIVVSVACIIAVIYFDDILDHRREMKELEIELKELEIELQKEKNNFFTLSRKDNELP